MQDILDQHREVLHLVQVALVEDLETFQLVIEVLVTQEVMIHLKETLEELELMLHLHMEQVEVVELVLQDLMDQVQVVVMVVLV